MKIKEITKEEYGILVTKCNDDKNSCNAIFKHDKFNKDVANMPFLKLLGFYEFDKNHNIHYYQIIR
jgi:hypothetical protein